METNLSPKRWREIALANFDRYVKKRLIETCYVINENDIDERELSCLAKEMDCCPIKLHQVIANSLGRIARSPVEMKISQEDEAVVMTQAAKLHIKESKTSLLHLKRELGHIVQELNHQSLDLKISKEELFAFTKPFYLEVIEEVFSL